MTNLLRNGNFEGGYYLKDGIKELAVPNEFDLWVQEDQSIRLERQDNPFLRPETVVWRKSDAPENEKNVFFLSGDFCLKVFKGWGPIWWRLSQTVGGLTIGNTYRFTAPVFPDLVMRYDDGKKMFADDPLAGEVQLMIHSAGVAIADGGLKTGSNFPFGQYTNHTLDFVAPSDTATVSLSCRGRWGLLENGFFVDSLALEEIASVPVQPPVPPQPDQTLAQFKAAQLDNVNLLIAIANRMREDMSK